MNRPVVLTPSNKRVFGACLLSLMTLIAPIASVGAATRRATAPLAVKNNGLKKNVESSLNEPAAAMPAPVPMPAPAPMLAAPMLAVGPITATKVDSFPDADGDGKAELGETITYTVGINNTGTDAATGVTFNDNIDANTTFVPGSMHASPIAFDDSYNWVGNTVLDTAVRSLPSVTANDVAITDAITVVTQTNAPTTQGGVVTLAANGHFVYTPQLGDGGPGFSDTFTYTIQNSVDNTLVGTGTVTINMPVRVWYLQAGAAGDGRSNTPSGNAATISTAANLASDILYVFFNAAALNGAITLDSGQVLTGEGVALVANSITLRPAGSTPTITNTTGTAVTLGGTNLVTGLNISQANNFAILGSGIGGTTNITGVVITNSGTGGGLSLTNQTGTFNMTNSPISGTTSGVAVFVSGGTGAINFSNSPVSRTTGRLLDIQSKTGGSVLFNGGSTVTGTAIATDAIILLNHTGGTTLTFSNNVNVTTSAGRGILAANSAGSFSLTMNAAANTISATGGAALDVEDITANMAFTSTSSSNSAAAPAHGLRVNNATGSLSFGTTAVTGSANTGVLLTSNASTLTFGDLDITPAAGQRGLLATENTGTITTTSGSITTTTGTGVEITKATPSTPLAMVLTLVSVNGAPSGIVIQNNTGSFSVIGDNTNVRNGTGGVMTGTTSDGIRLTNANNITLKAINLNSPGDTPQALLADNEGTLGEHGIEANGGSNIIVSAVLIDSPTGSGMIALNLTGTSRLNLNSLVTNVDGPATHGLWIQNSTGFSNTLFEVNNTDFTSSNSGASTVMFRNDGTANMNVSIINGCLFEGLNSQAITSTGGANAGTTGTVTSIINGNTFQNAQGSAENNVAALVSNGATHNSTIESNLFDNIAEDGTVANTSVIRTQNSGGKLTVLVKGNTIQNIAYPVGGRHVIGHVFEPISYNAANFSNVRIENNVATNITYNATNREFIFIDYREFSSGGDIKILGNNWNMPTSASTSEAIDLNFRGSNASQVDVQVDNNGNGTGAIHNTGTRFLRIDTEEATTSNLTITNNKFTNNNGTPGIAIDISTNDDLGIAGGPPTVCANVSGNNVTAAGNTIRLNEAVGTMNVTQPSAANMGVLNNGATVTVVGTPTFNQPACALPANLNFDPNEISWGVGAFDGPAAQQTAATSDGSSGLKVQPALARRSNTEAMKTTVNLQPSTQTSTGRFGTKALSHHAVFRSKGASTATTLKNTTTAAPLAPMPPLTPLNIGTLPGGKTVTIKFQVTVNTTGLGAATSVSNQGTVSGSNFASVLTDDPAVGGATDPTVTPIARLDVQVTKTDGVTTTTPGSDLTYTLTYTNNDHGANGVVLTETVPVGTVFKAAGSSVWTGCADGAAAGTVCTIALGNLPRNGVAGFTGTRTFVVTVVNPAAAGLASIVNTASIAHDGSYEPDINTANNTTTDTDTLTAAPDLNISKNDGVASTTPGSTLTYTINYSNVGTQNASGVVLTETVPVGTTFTTTGSSAWTGCANGAPAGTVCTISVGALTAGAPAASATFAVVVTNPAAAGLASIVNTASIADDGANGTDPTLPNTATDTDTLDATPDMTISKVADVTSVAPNDVITYTITYANVGTQNATGVVITETVPVNTTFSTAGSAPTVWSCADNSPGGTVCTTTIGAVAGGGGGGTVTFAVKVIDPLPLGATQITNTATIADDAGNGTDPTPANNTTGAVNTPIIVCLTPVPANMNAWWTGDETGSDPARDIAGGNDGTLNGNATYAAAKVLNGFTLDGTGDYVEAPDSNSLDITTAITIDAWINPTNAMANGRIVDKITPGNTDGYLFDMVNGNLRFISGTADVTTAQVIPQGVFTHVAVTYDGTNVVFYINGVAVNTTGATGAIPVNALPLRIGADQAGNFGFTGLIDEVEIFSRALSGVEIDAIFDAGTGGKCKPSDLRITKTHTDPFVQGSTGNTYTITVINDGPGTTVGTTTVTENLPAGLTATAMSGTGWTCGGTYPVTGPAVRTCTSTQVVLAGGSFDPITLTVTAGANSASVINNVTVSGGGEMDTSDDSANDTTNLTPSSDLLSVKIDSPDPVTAGTNITYGITLTNNGPSDAQAVTLTDAVPANTTFVSLVQDTGPTFMCTTPAMGGTGNVSCSLATLAAGASATFTMLVNVNAATPEGTTITNNAVAATTTNDPFPLNNTGTATTSVIQSDIEITSKTDTPDPVEAGSNITYTVNFKNNSAVNTASNVTVTDATPAGTTFVSAAAPAGWTPVTPAVGGTGNVVFSKALVAGAETAAFTIVVKVDNSVTSGTIVTNTATAATTSLDTVGANNSASAMTTVVVNADLAVTSKTDTPDPVLASQNITYAINFQNNGPSNAQGVTITDAVPAGTTFISAAVTTGTGWSIADPGVGNTGNVVFSKTTVAVAETAVFEVVVKVNNNAVEGSTITNSATAAGTTNDTVAGNNTAGATTTVNQSDIEITSKTDTPDPVEAGSNITYTVNFKNNSANSTAANVTVTDAIPAGTTFVSAAAPAGWTPVTPAVGGTGNVVFSKALVAVSETAVFTIVVKVNASVTSGTIVTNTATAATTSIDTVGANNSASTTTTVEVNADLAVTSKTDTPDPVLASQNITYAINFQNNGPSDGQTVTVTDAVPAGTTFISASVTTGTGWSVADPGVGNTGNVVFSKATVAVAETAVFAVVVKVNNSAVEGSIITNNATAAGTTNDPTPGNNTGTATTTVNQSDVEITKTDSPDPVTAGQDITYVITVENNSAVTIASDVTATDTIPVGTSFVSAAVSQGSVSESSGTVTGTFGTLAPLATATLTIVVKVNANVASGTLISNTANVTTSSVDSNSANNSATTTTTTNTSADLAVTKTDTPDPVTAGDNITYTINFVNNGPSDAQTVTVTDAVPANTTFVSAAIATGTGWSITSPAVGGTGNVVYSKPTVAAGETASFTLVVKVNSNAAAASTITNTATAASATSDPTPGNDSDTETTTVVTSADLLVVKIDSDDPVAAGANLTYTITVTNGGLSDAQNVSLSDTLPAFTTLVSFTVPAAWTRTDVVPVGGTGTVTATTPTLISGASAVFSLVVNVNIATPHGTILSNTATAATTTTDPNPLNNSSTETTTVIALPNAFDDQYFGLKDQVFNIPAPGVLSNDTGPNLVVTPVVGGTTTAGGTYTINANGSFTYTPPAGFSGTDGFDYTITNPAGSDSAHVELVVTDPATIALRISEFRFNGPNGATDEFFEIYNASPTAHQVGGTSLSNSGGYGLFASAGNGVTSNTVTMVCLIPNGTVIPARGYILCTGSNYSLAALGSVGSNTGSAVTPAINGAVPTAVGNFPIINGTVANPGAFTSADVPNDAGLVLANVGTNTVGASSDVGNGTFGFNATGVGAGNFTVWDRVGFAPYGAGAPLQTCQLVIPAGCGPSGSARPSLADNYCEGGAAGCLRPVGDASTTNHGTSVFYGDSGQYSLLRRQTTDQSATIGTVPQDTANNADDFLMVSPTPGINIAFTITNFPTGITAGLVSVLGAAGPQNNAAPPDLPETRLQSSLFDSSRTSAQLPNAERRYVLDTTTTTISNNPMGSFIFRFGFRNTSAAANLNRLRFRIDNLSVLCGQSAPPAGTGTVGSGNARNLSQTSPNCQGADNKTAILKMLNMPTELVAPENGPVDIVRGSVIEDTDGTKVAPNGGGVNTSLVRTGPAPGSLTGEFTTVVPAGGPGPRFFIAFRMGVVKGGSFRFLFQPEGSSTTPLPAPTVP